MEVPLSDLYCKILVQHKSKMILEVNGLDCYCCNGSDRRHVICKIKDTPHYQFLEGNRDIYQNYLEKGGRLVGYGLEHSVPNYDKLIKTFDLEKIKRFPCHEDGGKYILQDGVHRCSIILFNSLLETVPISLKKRR